MPFLLITLLCLISLTPSSAAISAELPEDKTSAVILAYHRIGEDAIPESNLRQDQFDEHIKEILNGNYTVLPLGDIIAAIKSKSSLPPRTLAITFEGGFVSAHKNAFPTLLDNNIPFTVFFSSGLTNNQNHIDWKQLKALNRNPNVTLGILPASYRHMSALSPAEQTRQINIARSQFKKNIGAEAQYLAYPFGEASNTLKDILKSQDFIAAFGLHSGVAHSSSDTLNLPRFTMTERYGDLQRLRLITNAHPLPAKDIEPSNWLITTAPSTIGFTLPETLKSTTSSLSCFISGQNKPDIEILGNRIEIRPQEPLDASRTRINCTLPISNDNDESPKWRWLGMLLHTETTPNNHQQGEPQ